MGFSNSLALLLATSLLVETCNAIHDAQSVEGQTNTDKAFVVIHKKISWWEAKKYCEESGMKLATIKSEEEQKALEQLLQKRGVKDEDLWLGGLGKRYNGAWYLWTWNLEEIVWYGHWGKNEPLGWELPFYCTRIRTKDNYQWATSPCWRDLKFVCENEMYVTVELTIPKLI